MNVNLNPARLLGLARAAVVTRPDEIDCDEWLARVGPYLEAVFRRLPVDDSLRLVREHLEVCPDCREEFEVMLAALAELARDAPPRHAPRP